MVKTMLSAHRQKGLTGYCFKYIDRPFCLQTDDVTINTACQVNKHLQFCLSGSKMTFLGEQISNILSPSKIC